MRRSVTGKVMCCTVLFYKLLSPLNDFFVFCSYVLSSKAGVNLKIKKAFCPPKVVEENPCIEYVKYIILPWFGSFEVVRKDQDGGNKYVSHCLFYACMYLIHLFVKFKTLFNCCSTFSGLHLFIFVSYGHGCPVFL